MKIIESQSAVLTNHEVYEHVAEQHRRYKRDKRRGPSNLETVVRELLGYLRTRSSPLSQEHPPYGPGCVAQLLEGLRPYELSKGEVVMILNLWPVDLVALNTVVEDMAERFTDEQQQDMVDVIARVLSRFDGAEKTADAGARDAAAA